MRKNHHLRIIFYYVIHTKHLRLHNRADRAAGSKKEVGYINFVTECFVGDDRAVLIHKPEITDCVINCISSFYITRSIDRQRRFFFFQTRKDREGRKEDYENGFYPECHLLRIDL